jgi:hypothetical protein
MVRLSGSNLNMKKSSWIVVASVALGALAACQPEKEEAPPGGRSRYGYQGTTTDSGFVTPTPTPDPAATETVVTAPPTPAPTPDTTIAAPPTRDLPYATPVPGKPGFVTSPHAAYAGYVDVRGFPPGTEVKCPYTSKIFLVP